MIRKIRCFIVVFALSLPGLNAPAQAKEPVDLLLALAADVSRSIDADKFKLIAELAFPSSGAKQNVNCDRHATKKREPSMGPPNGVRGLTHRQGESSHES